MASKPTIQIINVPTDIASIIKGKSLAPKALSQAGLAHGLQYIGFQVGTIEGLKRERIWHFNAKISENGVRNEAENVESYHEVKDAVSKTLANNSNPPFLLVVGGGCDTTPAILSGMWSDMAPKKIGLIYIDGDCDLAVPTEPGFSGILASMTGTHLTMREGALESMKPFTRPDGSGVSDSSNTVFFGLNAGLQGNSRAQLAYLFDKGFRVFTSSAVAKAPVERAEQALRGLEERVDAILVHLDVDAIDATTFPLANVSNRTGADFDKIMAAVKVFLKSEKVCGLVVAEVNPDHDPGSKMIGRLVDELIECFKDRL